MRRESDVAAAIREFERLREEGLTEDKLRVFLKECEEHGPDFLTEVKRYLQVLAASSEVVQRLERPD